MKLGHVSVEPHAARLSINHNVKVEYLLAQPLRGGAQLGWRILIHITNLKSNRSTGKSCIKIKGEVHEILKIKKVVHCGQECIVISGGK